MKGKDIIILIGSIINAMGIGGQREGAEASVEKQYVHTNVIDTLEVTCTTGVRTRVTQAVNC